MTESEHSEEVERVVETHSQQQQPSGLWLLSESGIGEPMFDNEEDEEPPPSHNLKASRFATGQ